MHVSKADAKSQLTEKARKRTAMRNPKVYAGWALFVAASLGVTYFVDPYVFAFTHMILGGASLALGALGLVGAWRNGKAGFRVTTQILGYLALTFVVLVLAFLILGKFRWA